MKRHYERKGQPDKAGLRELLDISAADVAGELPDGCGLWCHLVVGHRAH